MNKQLLEFGLALVTVIVIGIVAPVYAAGPCAGWHDSATVPDQAKLDKSMQAANVSGEINKKWIK